MIFQIDGYDLNSRASITDVPGLQDYSLTNYTPAFNNLFYAPGYLTGQAIFNSISPAFGFGGIGGSNGNSIPANQQITRTTWFAKRQDNGGTVYPIWLGFMMLNVNSNYIGVQLNSSGNARIARGGYQPSPGPTDGTAEIMSGISSQVIGFGWTFYDFYANFQTNTFQLRINGVLECSGSLASPQTVVGGTSVSHNHPFNYNIHVDHVVTTDGESLVGTNKIHAIAPTAAFAGAGTLRGNLIMGGASYQTLRQGALIYRDTFGSDNAANVAFFVYPKSPVTNLAWTQAEIDALQGWGVCAGNLTIGGNKLHMTSLGLSVVETKSDPNGYPIIKVLSPGGLTYYSGAWVKSVPNKSLSAHVNDIPRTVAFANDLYLETDVDGCVLFQPDSGLLSTFGITFAEEFREDFTDWFRIIYGGLPFVSYFITGYTILGEGNKKFQSNYVSVNYENVPVGGAYLQGVWDYALTPDSGRWGTRQQIYRLSSDNYKYQVSKLKVRGHGTSMQIKVTSEQGKDFRLSGWSVAASGNTGV